jgi:hypothetical protein
MRWSEQPTAPGCALGMFGVSCGAVGCRSAFIVRRQIRDNTTHNKRHTMQSIRYSRIAILVLTGMTANAAAVISTFDLNSESWQRVHLPNSGSVTSIVSGPVAAAWRSTSGNPAGNIYISDQVSDSLAWFSAPARFLGDQSARYGGTIQWDHSYSYIGQATVTNNTYPDIALLGGGLALVADAGTSANMPNQWAPFSTGLCETNGWHIGFLTNRAPTEAEFKAVLANLQRLYVRAEYIGGDDIGYLDNFQMTDGECPPSSIRISEVEVCWQSQSNRQYRVDYRSALETTNMWVPFPTNIFDGDGQVICIYDKIPPQRPRRFYRVVCDP